MEKRGGLKLIEGWVLFSGGNSGEKARHDTTQHKAKRLWSVEAAWG